MWWMHCLTHAWLSVQVFHMRSGPETLLTNPGLIAKVLMHRAKRTLQMPSASQAAVVHLLLLLLPSICFIRVMLLVY